MIVRRLLLLAALLAGCADPATATEVLVVVDSDLAIGSALTNLRMRVYDREGKTQVAMTDFALSPQRGPATFPLPLSYSLVPRDGVRQFRLIVTGQGPKDGAQQVDIVERQAIASFGDGQRLLLPIYLDGRCLNQLCRDEGPDKTCNIGQCETVQEQPLGPAGDGPIGDYDAAAAKPPATDAGPDGARDAEIDGGPDGGPDAGPDASPDAGPDASTDAGTDAGSDAGPPACGTWVASNKNDVPPAAAVAYGHEYNDSGNYNQYVCRVRLSPTTVLPGKGVYGFSCYYIAIDNSTRLFADNFEVLVDSGNCATMTPVLTAKANSLPLLPTGQNGGSELYSCIDSVISMGATPSMAMSQPLGRYDLATETCYYEWDFGTRFSQPDGQGKPTFSVLTRGAATPALVSGQ